MSAEDDIHASLLAILSAYHPAREALKRKAFVPQVVRSFLTERGLRRVPKTRNVTLTPEDVLQRKWRAEFIHDFVDQQSYVYRREPPRLLSDLVSIRKHGPGSTASIVPRGHESEWSSMGQARRKGLVMVRRIADRDQYDSGKRYFLTAKGECFADMALQLYWRYFH